ncbi:MAG: hypothetical protein QOJ35_3967 [Solirubrobacteraceae bacterium]|nr:hypothetical protein [Solirubrobacteraceae bacterium]
MAVRARSVAPALVAALLALSAPAVADAPAPAPPSPSAPVVALAPPVGLVPAVAPVPVVPPEDDVLPGGVRVGIGDQKVDMFSDPRFVALGVRHARLAIGWDAMESPWQVQQIDAWLSGARALRITPLISLGHSRTVRRSLPTVGRLRLEFRRMRRRYPWVTTYATWNEANHCGEPVCHRPALAAAYYRALRSECPSCTILAPEILDLPNGVAYVKAMRARLGFTPKRWGVHNYLEANRFKMTRLRALLQAMPGADVWLTETGGLVRRDNGSTTDIPEGAGHAAEVTRYIFDRVLPENPRIRAVYLYHWNAGPLDTTWDSGLITPHGRERIALQVLRRVLRFGQRPRANYRSPGR